MWNFFELWDMELTDEIDHSRPSLNLYIATDNTLEWSYEKCWRLLCCRISLVPTKTKTTNTQSHSIASENNQRSREICKLR